MPLAIPIAWVLARRARRGQCAVCLELITAATLRLHRFPRQFEALACCCVIRTEPQIQLIAGRDEIAAMWQTIATIASNDLCSRSATIVDLQPVKATLSRILQIKTAEGDIQHQRLVGTNDPGTLRIVLVTAVAWRIPQTTRQAVQHAIAAAEAHLAQPAPIAGLTLTHKFVAILRGCGTAASVVLAGIRSAHTGQGITVWTTKASLALARIVARPIVQADTAVL